MPAILDRLVRQLRAQGRGRSAWPIAVAAMQRAGNLRKGTLKATKKGVRRGRMTPRARRRDRARRYARGSRVAASQ